MAQVAEFQADLEFCGHTEVVKQLLGSVLRGLEVKELLVLVDELGVHGGVQELVVGQDVLEEGDVGLEKRQKIFLFFVWKRNIFGINEKNITTCLVRNK